MAHRIIGYYTLEQLNKILNKTVYMYYKSQYMYSAKITEITSVESDARFAFAIFSQRRGGSSNTEDFYFALITNARNNFNLKYEVVQYYDNYPYGNFTDPPKSPSASWENVVSFGEDSQTVIPVSQSSQFYPYTVVTFARTAVYYNDGAQRYTDSDGCLMIIDNNSILNDWDLSVSGTTANEISYVRSIMSSPAVLPSGSGEVTLNLKAPGQTLTFTSALLGSVVNQYISGDAVIDMESESNNEWELLWKVKFAGVDYGLLMVDSDFNSTYSGSETSALDGKLLKQTHDTHAVLAKKSLQAWTCYDTDDSSHISWQSFSANDTVFNFTDNYNTRVVFTMSKTFLGNTYPFEVACIWHNSAGYLDRIIVKRDGTQLANDVTVAGEFITLTRVGSTPYSEGITITPFNGTIKIFKNNDPTVSMSGSNGYSVTSADTALWMIFAIPS